jgi:hypothetical protein
MRRFPIALAVIVVLVAAPGASAQPYPPDYHSNCTAGFAAGEGGQQLSVIARPPKSEPPKSDVGTYSSTNCQ